MSILPVLALLSVIGVGDAPPAPPREFRAVWVATVDNIDWPSKRTLSTDEAQAELAALIDKAADLHFNAVIFQVRPMADALYDSKLEPWSEFLTGTQGTAPKPAWDPLKFAIDKAHERGLELHAWFNPFRAWHPAAKSAPSKNHVTVQHPSWVKTYGSFKWLDPGDVNARSFSLKVFQDVVSRYDIDGIHIDDYFYPYPIKGQDFPDDPTYFAYTRAGGKMSRGDWRRNNVNEFVQNMYESVKRLKPWVKVGISPFGIYRPGIPEGIQSSVDQYDGLYADVKLWLQKGWCDYLSPQLYWKESATHQAYDRLLTWWQSQNVRGRAMWPGNFASQLETSANWSVAELLDQIRITRETPGAGGNVFFSVKPFLHDAKGINEALLSGPYQSPALVPDCPWLGGKPPTKPEIVNVHTSADWEAEVKAPKDAVKLIVWSRYGSNWTFKPAPRNDLVKAATTLGGVTLSEVAVAGVDRFGTVGPYAIWK